MMIGKKIKILRNNANMSQEDLAEKLFVSRELVSKWETGLRRPDKDTIKRMAKLFSVDEKELVNNKSIIVTLPILLICALSVILLHHLGKTKVEKPEPSSIWNDNSPVLYADLFETDHRITKVNGNGAASYISFTEKLLKNDVLIIEGSITDTYVKPYDFIVEANRKFENAGGKMTIKYSARTIVTTIRVEKIWKSDGLVKEGDELTFEDELISSDGHYGFSKGGTYVVHLTYDDDGTLITGRPTANDEVLIEGDNKRVSGYSNGYSLQPSIEKTDSGDYIVPDTWETLVADDVKSVILDDYSGSLKLIRGDDFNERMKKLISQIYK